MKACKQCKAIVEEGNECKKCGSRDLTSNWNGIVIIFDYENSEVAKKFGIQSNGKFAIRV